MALNVAGAYHSRLMEPARAEFAAYLARINFKQPTDGHRVQQHDRAGRQ